MDKTGHFFHSEKQLMAQKERGFCDGSNRPHVSVFCKLKDGRIVDAVELKRRVKLYKDHQRDGYGAIILQANWTYGYPTNRLLPGAGLFPMRWKCP